MALEITFQRTRAKNRVVTFLGYPLFRLRVEFDRIDKQAVTRRTRVSLLEGPPTQEAVGDVKRATLAAFLSVPSYTTTSEALERFVAAQITRQNLPIQPARAVALSKLLLEYFLDSTCPTCKGVAYDVIPGTTHLSVNACPSCQSSGKRPIFVRGERPTIAERDLVTWVQANIDRKMDRFTYLIACYLRDKKS